MNIFPKITNLQGDSTTLLENNINKHKNDIFCTNNEDCDVYMDNNNSQDELKLGVSTLPLNYLNKSFGK